MQKTWQSQVMLDKRTNSYLTKESSIPARLLEASWNTSTVYQRQSVVKEGCIQQNIHQSGCAQKKSGPYPVVWATPHTVTIHSNSLHTIGAIDQVTLTQAAQKTYRNTNKQVCNSQFLSEHGTVSKHFYVGEPFSEWKQLTTPRRNDP